MKDLLPTRSLRLRLTLWYAVTSLIILLALGALLLTLGRYRLSAELDRHLRNDSEFVSARLEHADGSPIGSLLVYSNEPEAFDEKETELLQQAANDVAKASFYYARGSRASVLKRR